MLYETIIELKPLIFQFWLLCMYGNLVFFGGWGEVVPQLSRLGEANGWRNAFLDFVGIVTALFQEAKFLQIFESCFFWINLRADKFLMFKDFL